MALSTVTLQDCVDDAFAHGDLFPVLTNGGLSTIVAQNCANKTMQDIIACPFPWKWNEFNFPVFVINSYQQDYAGIYPSGASITNLAWLQRGIAVDINFNSQPMPSRQVECGRQLEQSTANPFYWSNGAFRANWFPNSTLYYGTWGATTGGNTTYGNNPVADSVYTSPYVAGEQPNNPIQQIQDANGNLLVLTTYGAEGSAAPVLSANATPGTTVSGTGATTVWTVVDPNGQGFRILPVPQATGVAWQISLTGQMKPVRFTSLAQTLTPIPDEFEQRFKDGFVANLYRYSGESKVSAKFDTAWKLWMKSLYDLRASEDRELEEHRFIPERTIFSGSGGSASFYGPAWPFNGPPPTNVGSW